MTLSDLAALRRPSVRSDGRERSSLFRLITMPRLLFLSSVCGVLLGAQPGCSGDTTNPVSLPASQTFWALQLNQHAINLALTAPAGQTVVDTVQLTAVALNAASTPLPGTASVRYRSTDSTVTVDSTGLATAHYTTAGTRVIATLTVRGVTLTDTAYIKVTKSPFSSQLATFSIQPLPLDLDSAKAAEGYNGDINNGSGTIPVYATDAAGDSLCSADLPCQLLVAFSSSDTTIARIASVNDREGNPPGYVTPLLHGHVTFYATTLAYGVAKRDSLRFTVGYPLYGVGVFADHIRFLGDGKSQQTFFPTNLHVGIGAQVFFDNTDPDSVDVVVTGSSHDFTISAFGQGNQDTTGSRIFPLSTDGLGDDFVVVNFPTAGTYTFHSTVLGTSGTIIVSSGP